MNRRHLLQGLGATLTLPWFESLASSATAKAPVRYGCLLFANGVNPHEWDASGEGAAMRLSSTLQPLEELKEHITVLKDLHVFNNTSGPHWPLFSNYLSGAQFKETLIPEGGESIDQVIARHTGKETAVPSLVLAVEPAESGLRGGVPSVYYGTVSWSSKNTPIAPEVYPRAVFDRLFDTSGLLRDKSVLDAVLTQSKDMRGRLGSADQQKLDEFMHSVRDLELRIERAAKEERLEGWRPTLAKPDMERPSADLPQDVREHMRMMLDLILLAWRMDKTRVATLIFNRDVSHMKFGFLDGVLNDQLHGISHHKEDAEKLASYARINRFHVERLAYLMKRMKEVDEGGGATMLDNVMLQFGSNMFNGDSHDGRNLPMILAGHGGGGIAGGRVIDTGSLAEENQRACNLYLSLAKRMGVEIDRFGDSVEPLSFS
ncbi:MAG: DUF1552 domain-containing protein [Verrucomicrobiae bacterium]|nr:DUF1552 domain-containing protein [Verrucomicrobiae bacterium]MCP5541029.1 DUF1552 domain-containing protein [Akkermansiaceae bacterium]MCP5551548.1 DUF1552 domain-containing protein [Akkermansiaceae bacterium]